MTLEKDVMHKKTVGIISFRNIKISALSGFTLVELMMVVAIISILAAIAYPLYTNYSQQSQRADAIASLLQLQFNQEKWRATHPAYTENMLEVGGTASINSDSMKGNYTLNIIEGSASANGFLATATPNNDTAMASDPCGVFALNQDGPYSIGYAPSLCWNNN